MMAALECTTLVEAFGFHMLLFPFALGSLETDTEATRFLRRRLSDRKLQATEGAVLHAGGCEPQCRLQVKGSADPSEAVTRGWPIRTVPN